MKQYALILLAVLAVPASVRAQAAAPVEGLMGVYDVQLQDTGGPAHGGRLVLRHESGAYQGSIAPDGSQLYEFKTVAIKGDSVTAVVEPEGAGGSVTLRMAISGTTLKGEYAGVVNGTLSGTKLR